jgi:hypothetical protein
MLPLLCIAQQDTQLFLHSSGVLPLSNMLLCHFSIFTFVRAATVHWTAAGFDKSPAALQAMLDNNGNAESELLQKIKNIL